MLSATILVGSNAPFAIPTGRPGRPIARIAAAFDRTSASRIGMTIFWSIERYFA
jgi:hypothetical protein